MMFKVDFHTHSIASPDGGISVAQYKFALDTGILDYVAVTDHNRIDFALELHKELGDKIIVGEEIMTTAGEIIGLYLTEVVQPGMSPSDTITAIKSQGGIVYIPHPFETVRKGIHPQTLEEIHSDIDLIEVVNGRAFLQNRSNQVLVWSKLNRVPGLASSDAHGASGLGKTYSRLPAGPTQETIVQLAASAIPITSNPGLRALLYPRFHAIRKKLRKAS